MRSINPVICPVVGASEVVLPTTDFSNWLLRVKHNSDTYGEKQMKNKILISMYHIQLVKVKGIAQVTRGHFRLNFWFPLSTILLSFSKWVQRHSLHILKYNKSIRPHGGLVDYQDVDRVGFIIFEAPRYHLTTGPCSPWSSSSSSSSSSA